MITRRHCLSAIAATLVAQPPLARTTMLGAEALQADWVLLADALQALHPGRHRYLTPAAYGERLAGLRQAWSHEQTLPQAYRSLALFLSSLRCGHTYGNFYNQRGAARQQLVVDPPKLPLQFTWLGERMVVTHKHPQVPRGSQLQRIDGTPAAQLLATLMPAVRTDGHNEAGRRALLCANGADRIETFDVMHPLFFVAGPRFEIDLLTPAGQARRVIVDAATDAQRQAERGPRPPASDHNPPWPVQWRDDGVAVLTMPSWAVYNLRWDWRAYLERQLDRLVRERCRGLVVDLRGNEGGLDCGDPIIARLIDRPLELQRFERRLRYRRVPAHLNPVLDTWDDGFRDWGDRVTEAGDGSYRFASANGRDIKRIEPLAPRFEGRVAMLLDGSNQSATFAFADILRSQRLGQLVGQTSGGNQRGINGGAFFFLRLPGSGLEVDIPLVAYHALGDAPDAGLAPDVAVQPSVDDIAAGRDTVLERALALLRG